MKLKKVFNLIFSFHFKEKENIVKKKGSLKNEIQNIVKIIKLVLIYLKLIFILKCAAALSKELI